MSENYALDLENNYPGIDYRQNSSEVIWTSSVFKIILCQFNQKSQMKCLKYSFILQYSRMNIRTNTNIRTSN